MVWLLLTALILLAQQYHFLWEDRNEERTVNKVLVERIERLQDQRAHYRRSQYYTDQELQAERRCSKAAIEQAQIWSARAIKLGFYRRQHKNAVRNARRSNKT
jgi:hypothetical protein